MLTTSLEILQRAQKNGYAVGAFNFHNLEILQSILETAEAERAPVIIQTTPTYLENMGASAAAGMARAAAAAVKVPVALHLDHSDNLKWIIWALANGFTSVMIDGSRLPLNENIAITTRATKAAHAAGVTIEAEIGSIGGVEDSAETGHSPSGLADPYESQRFVLESGIDLLAPALGTAHGIYKSTPKIDYDRLAQIHNLIQVPLVLHGGSGVPDQMVLEAVAKGITKVNIGTELKVAWARSITETLKSETEPWKVAVKVRAAVREVVRHKIALCGNKGKA
ncbi:class II fructose-bisphosphate aldolase [Desulfitobacterium sp.]|uniref:class II fructose-bisphosphate aldolase n=1 Tax=Desulfitobacterium sp. TaxID=49981 RepID=UPI002B1F122D|nr:class II fructose-bisphosphate aldolase [Desulfitobacterium sp.]MEA4900676.1 class II fructose-bisphosphate aldolase [Desulfitobacterium sp.]